MRDVSGPPIDATGTASPEEKALSVVIPAFNLERTIGTTVRHLRDELRAIAPVLEFVVVDDGSADATAAVVEQLRSELPEIRLLRNRRNYGKGMSVYLGLLASRYARACFVDGDLPFAGGCYARVLEPLMLGRSFVTASRRLADSEIRLRIEVLRYAARRHVVGIVFNALVRTSLGLPYRDTQCGLKGFDRAFGIELFRRVHSVRFLFDVELLLAARELRVPVDEVPVCVCYDDVASSVKILGRSAQTFLGLMRIAVRARMGGYRRTNPAMDPERIRALAEEVVFLRAEPAPSAVRNAVAADQPRR
jgi:glycosyltransferase involved in cell wall biosynthesis